MDILSRRVVHGLLSGGGEGPHVSIYMPTVRAGQQTLQNPIRFKNLMREAESRLRERGMNAHEAAAFLDPALHRLGDDAFWQHQDAGLSVFIAGSAFQNYRLPIDFPELVMVQDRFYIKPLLPALTEDERFYILALSQNRARLLEGGRHSAREVELQDVPRSLVDALGNELTPQHLAFHGATGAGAGERPSHKGEVASGPEDDIKSEIRQYLKQLNQGLKQYLCAGQPLVLAGVEYLLAIYRQETDYKSIAGTIAGNFDVESPQKLHEQAWPIVEPYFARARQDALMRYAELTGTGRAVNGLEEIVLAGSEGRIDTLFIARDIQHWGKFDADARKVHVHEKPQAGDEDLLDLVAAHTFLNNGRVFVLLKDEVPDGQPQAAILRY
jgi:hypothetical protein